MSFHSIQTPSLSLKLAADDHSLLESGQYYHGPHNEPSPLGSCRLSEQLHPLQRTPGCGKTVKHASGTQASKEPTRFPASPDDTKSEANSVTWRGYSEKNFHIGERTVSPQTGLSPAEQVPDHRNFAFPKIVQRQDDSTVFLNHSTEFGSPTSIPCRQNFSDHINLPNSKAPSSTHGFQLPHVPSRPAVSNAQLTIFYRGTVNVYDDVPTDKAHAIMLLAGTGNSRSTTAPPPEGENNNLRGAIAADGSITVDVPASGSPTEAKAQAVPRRSHAGIELPHPRKASLARFLEKRKERVQVKQQGSEQREEKGEGRASSPKKRCTDLAIAIADAVHG